MSQQKNMGSRLVRKQSPELACEVNSRPRTWSVEYLWRVVGGGQVLLESEVVLSVLSTMPRSLTRYDRRFRHHLAV